MNKPLFSLSLLTVFIATLFMRVDVKNTTAQNPIPVTFQAVQGGSRGYLTTPQELVNIRNLASQGLEPYKYNVDRILRDAGDPLKWDYGTVGGSIQAKTGDCYSPYHSRWDLFFAENYGAQEVYRKVMAYYFSGNIAYARNAREKILDLTDTYDFGGELYSGNNQCILELGFALPVWIQAADLLSGTSVWTNSDKASFQRWLAQQAYPKVAWASRVRTNNWGAAGSLTASLIADYLTGSGIALNEYNPQRQTLTSAQAYTQHNAQQVARMTGAFKGDSQCTKYGVQWYGGIPDELRRGATGCLGEWITSPDQSLSYQTLHVEILVYHGEFLWRRGDNSMYNNGLILKAIKFVIANPHGMSTEWIDYRKGVMFVAFSFYNSFFLKTSAQSLETFKGGGVIPYAPVTHPLGTRTVVYTSQPPR